MVHQALLQLPGQLVVVDRVVLLRLDTEEDDESVKVELCCLEEALDEAEAILAPGAGVVGVELAVLVVIQVDLLAGLLAALDAVGEGAPHKHVPHRSLVDLLQLLDDGIAVMLNLASLFLV